MSGSGAEFYLGGELAAAVEAEMMVRTLLLLLLESCCWHYDVLDGGDGGEEQRVKGRLSAGSEWGMELYQCWWK